MNGTIDSGRGEHQEASVALVTEFFPDKANSKRHPTKVECGWQVITEPDGPLLQLSTYGSDDRAAGKKVSQT